MLKSGAGCQTPMLCCTLFKHSVQSTGFPYFSLYSPGVDFLKSSQTWRKHPETDFTHFHEHQNLFYYASPTFVERDPECGSGVALKSAVRATRRRNTQLLQGDNAQASLPPALEERSLSQSLLEPIRAIHPSTLGICGARGAKYSTWNISTRNSNSLSSAPKSQYKKQHFSVWCLIFLYTTTFLSVKRFQTCFFFWGVLL